MGIRLLYRMMNVSRLYAKFREMSPEVADKIPSCNNPDLPKHAINIMRLKQSWRAMVSPARDRYQQASSVCSLFQMAAPTELTSAMTSRMPNRTRICMLVTRSTLERFSGALVEFWELERLLLGATFYSINYCAQTVTEMHNSDDRFSSIFSRRMHEQSKDCSWRLVWMQSRLRMCHG